MLLRPKEKGRPVAGEGAQTGGEERRAAMPASGGPAMGPKGFGKETP